MLYLTTTALVTSPVVLNRVMRRRGSVVVTTPNGITWPELGITILSPPAAPSESSSARQETLASRKYIAWKMDERRPLVRQPLVLPASENALVFVGPARPMVLGRGQNTPPTVVAPSVIVAAAMLETIDATPRVCSELTTKRDGLAAIIAQVTGPVIATAANMATPLIAGSSVGPPLKPSVTKGVRGLRTNPAACSWALIAAVASVRPTCSVSFEGPILAPTINQGHVTSLPLWTLFWERCCLF